MKYLKPILITLFMIGIAIPINAQHNRRDKIKSLKIAFITEKLSLSSQEAEKFWPIYNEFDDSMHQLRSVELRGIKERLKGQDLSSISENEAQDMLDEIGNIESRLYEKRKNLISDLRKVISAKKIILLKKVEDDFNRELISRLRNKRKSYRNR